MSSSPSLQSKKKLKKRAIKIFSDENTSISIIEPKNLIPSDDFIVGARVSINESNASASVKSSENASPKLISPISSRPAPKKPTRNSRFASNLTDEEKYQIRLFWLSLSDRDIKEMIELEKETTLKIWRDQQKLCCNCSFCGRKRCFLIYFYLIYLIIMFESIQNCN